MAGNKPFNKQTEPRERDPQLAGLKVPPHSIEAEQSVLGGLMLDNERWDDVAERVVTDDFYTRPHRHIFTEMARLQESGSPIDLITLAESLERQGQLDSVGGFAYLAELSKNTPSAANISAYADIVRERAVVRDMISVANEIAEAGFDPQGRNSDELLDLAESRVFKIAESRANKDEGPKNISEVLDATVSRIEQLFQQPHDGVTGALTADAALLSAAERQVIDEAAARLSAVAQGNDADAIEEAIKNVDKQTQDFAARRMDKSVRVALKGQSVDEV
jgi:replicative DNA helicase